MDNDLKKIAAIILAAGQGTRMKSSLPKVLHPLAGKPLVLHAIENAGRVVTETPVLVIGHGAEEVRAVVGNRARFAIQHTQMGTADAVKVAQPLLADFTGLILVVSADMPLFTPPTLQRLITTQRNNKGAMSMLSVCMDDPHGFGRVVRHANGTVAVIVEEAQADAATLAIHELNVGAYCFRSDWLWGALESIKPSPKGEYYLTDTVELAVRDNQPVECLLVEDADETIGINTRVHLAEAEAVLRQRINTAWMLAGVTLIDPQTTYIEPDVTIQADTVIFPNTHLSGSTHIGSGCQLGPNVSLWNSQVGDNCVIGPQVVLRNTQLEKNQVVRFAILEHILSPKESNP